MHPFLSETEKNPIKVSIPNRKKGDRQIELERDLPDGKLLEIIPPKIKTILLRRTSIPIGKRHRIESRTMWLKKEKRRNAALVAAWTTTPGESAVSQFWFPQLSHTKIGETLNNHLNQELAHSQCTNLLQQDKNHLQRLTY